MREFIRFDVVRFLKASRHWDGEIADLKHEIDAITEIGGAGNGLPSGGEVSRPVERTAVARDEILQKIDKIQEYKECFRYAWDRMDEDDLILLKGFYYAPGYIYEFIEWWVDAYASNRQYCYRAKREAESCFALLCVEWMGANGYDV